MSQDFNPHTGEKDGKLRFGVVAWTAVDVMELRPLWSESEAEAFLADAERQIADDMVARGWDSIDALLDLWEKSEAEPRRQA